MVWSFVYLALHRVLELMVLCWRSTDANEVEILVLCHQLAILPPAPASRLQPKDRALLAALSHLLPRPRWPRQPDPRIRTRSMTSDRFLAPTRCSGGLVLDNSVGTVPRRPRPLEPPRSGGRPDAASA
jgi:hypothetical protein